MRFAISLSWVVPRLSSSAHTDTQEALLFVKLAYHLPVNQIPPGVDVILSTILIVQVVQVVGVLQTSKPNMG
ncbi:MAG: hypothetical protein ACI8T1_005331 [Verrucomicrobiales bacterium]|jgi:hypothetical protein